MTDNKIIADSADIAEAHGLGPDDYCSFLEATEKPTAAKLEFHVQMRGYTLTDMETLIIEAAARQLLWSVADKHKMEARIRDAVYASVTAQIEKQIANVTADVLSTVMVSGKEPVTVKQFIEMSWRDWLQKNVDTEGKDYTGYSSSASPRKRFEWIVWRALESKWIREITAATNSAVAEMQKSVSAKQAEILSAEKARLAAALSALTGEKP